MALLWVVSSACKCGGPVDGGGTTVSGTVLRDGLCEAVAGAEVKVLDASAGVTTSAEGTFELAGVPSNAVFEISAPGVVPTLSAVRVSLENGGPIELAAVSESAFDLLYLLAGVQQNPKAGSVVSVTVDARQLPVGEAQVELLHAEDGQPAGGERRYAEQNGSFLIFPSEASRASTDGQVGMVVFLNVGPGEYLLRVTREGYVFPEQRVTVQAGKVSADFHTGQGEGGSAPVEVSGTVYAAPPYCQGGDFAPAAGALVSVYSWSDGATYETTSDADGGYRVELPFIRRRIDVTASLPNRRTVRGRAFCALTTSFNVSHKWLRTQEQEQAWLNMALEHHSLDPDAGHVRAAVERFNLGTPVAVGGARLRLAPDVASVSYDVLKGNVSACASRSCTSANDCAAGARCENGECLLGVAGPLCQRCGAGGSCPAGYRGEVVNNFAIGTTACHCLPERSGCPPPTDQPCPQGTFCYAWGTCVGGPLRHVCLPLDAKDEVTQLDSAGRALWAVIPNVPEGRYTLHAEADAGVFFPARLRVSAGISHEVWVSGP
ncbi:MAG: MSCRAMM family protein [Myxococcota bacterium]